MTKMQAMKLIDDHKNRLINPREMLDWTWLRVILNEIHDDQWEAATGRAVEIMSR